MKFRSIFILITLLILISSINCIVATEINNESINYPTDVLDGYHVDDIDINSQLSTSEEINLQETNINSINIYVGSNIAEDGGNGSYENPYTTLNQVSDSLNGEDNVTINMFGGTYYLDSHIKFNVSNLFIKGINGPVIIKNKYDVSNDHLFDTMAIGLTSSSSNFTISNIIYDATNYSWGTSGGAGGFCLFFGDANLGIYNNCSFIGLSNMRLSGGSYNSEFNNCYFEGPSSNTIFFDKFSKETYHKFEYCSFNLPNCPTLATYDINTNIYMDNCWFGENSSSLNTPPNGYKKDGNKNYRKEWIIPTNRYAQFSAYENYLGNNQYEIIGKLVWNGTDDNDGMENFQPMNVTLSSKTGIIQSNVLLENGTFRVIYTSNSSEHEVITELCSQTIDINFNSINLTVDAPSIYYGEDQNISVKLPQVFNGNVSIIVNNKTYSLTFNDTDVALYTIEDILTEGNYTVDVLLIDGENHLYGSNSTILTISKVNNYAFDVVPSSEVKVGENARIDITLPEDVEGNVTIKFGNDIKTLPANQTMVVNFNNLNATTYPVTVTYTGSDKYTGKEKVDSITVDKADSSVSVENSVFTYGDVIAIPFITINASGVNVRVLNKDGMEVANTTTEGTEFTFDTLPAGEYTLEVTTIVNDNYEEFTADDISLTINKAESDLTLNDSYEFTYGENAVINVVTENSTGEVIVSLDGFTANVSGNEIILPTLNVGKYTLTVTTNPDENHNNVTKTATVTINKAAPSMNVVFKPVENITAKDQVTLTISLPSDATGDVVVKVNGKKTETVSANETITIDLNNQAGDYVIDVTYSGDKNYESDMATQDYAVSKAETLITAKQIDFEEGTATIEVNITDVNSGIILVDVDGKKFYGDINNGKATVNIEGVPEGNYTANIKFFGDDKYNQATTTTDVKVSEDKIITELKEQLEEANAKVDNLTGELANATDKIADLTAVLNETQANVTKLSEDLADAQSNVTKLSDDLANANAKVDNLTGELVNATDKIDDLTAVLNETQANATKLSEDLADAQANVTRLSDDLAEANAKVDNLTGELVNATDKIADLTAVLNETQANVTKLSEDLADAQANVTKLSDDLADANAKVDNLTAVLNETQANATKLSEDLADANQKVNNLTTQLEKAQSNVTIVVDGVEYLVDVVNGTATIKTNSTKPITKKDTVIVVDKTFTRVANDYNAGERGGMFYAILKDSDGNVLANKTVQIAVNGPIYNVTTDDQGRAGLQVNLANANTYTYALSFQGDDEYNSAPIASSKLTVTKKKTTIKASNKVFKAKIKTKKISVTLKTVKNQYDKKTYLKSGKKVTLKVNGKTYTAKINKKGVAKFTIKITKKGKYTAKIKFAGDKTYKASSKTIKIRIK